MVLSQGSILLPLLLASVYLVRASLSAPDAFCVTPVGRNCKSVQEYQCKQCKTLQWYTANPTVSRDFSYSVLYFLHGHHQLPNSSLTISNVSNFAMKGSKNSSSTISCTHWEGGVLFFNSTNVNMTDIQIFHCGTDVPYNPDNFTVHAAVSVRSSSNFVLSRVLISNSSGLGLHMDRMSGYNEVLDSKFMYSNGSTDRKYVANARFYYGNDSKEDSTLLIENCSFLHGDSNRKSNLGKTDSSGLLILIYAPSIQVTIKNITAEYNHAGSGGNVGIVITYFHENTSTISISNSSISYGIANKGGGLICFMRLNHSTLNSCHKETIHTIVNISHVDFFNNSAVSGGAVYIHQQQLGSVDCMLQQITFNKCMFMNNNGIRGIAVAIIKFLIPDIWPHNAVQFNVTFQYCVFSNNTQAAYIKRNSKASVMMLLQADSVTVTSSNFTCNKGSAISLVNSNLIFKGSILFKRNIAIHGGALNLCDSSLIYLSPHTYVKLVENKAKVSGGAIFAEQRRLDSDPPCFYQPLVHILSNESEIKEQVQFEYINNSAGIAGHAIYGGSVDNCYLIEQFHVVNCTDLFNVVHNLTQQPGPSSIASDPNNVMFCDPQTNTTSNEQQKQFHLYPGEQFSISVSAVGQMNGLVPAYISVLPDNSVRSKWPKDTRRRLCRTVNLTVLSNSSSLKLDFSIEFTSTASSSVASTFYHKPPHVIITIKDCPWIFTLSKVQSCDCAPVLHKIHTIKCNIISRSFNRGDKSVWVGCLHNNKSTANESACDQILLTDKCPEELCTDTVSWLSQENASNQCQDGREGILCGRCREDYSLSLGPQDCVSNDQCPLWRLPILLLAFVIVGLLLVLFLTVSNLTVSQGTLYGLLFYANVVHVNHKTLLKNCSSIFRIFIAWLNLEFGFNMCLYGGMDAYQKVWLEFVFILYLLAIAIIIVYLSHKFICVTRLVGRNIVSALSTVLLLSSTKAARTAVKTLRYIDLISSSSEKSIRVWYYDGNITYLQGKHIPLTLVSILVVAIVSLYMFSLLFIQCLQRGSGWCVLRWVNKLRPFFDANTGPSRDQFRFWPGFLLFLLLAIFSLHASTAINAKSHLYIALASCVLIFVLACISPRGVYKKWPLNVLEFSFLLNLGSLCGIVATVKDDQSTLTSSVSIGIAMLTFVLILGFHGYQRVSGTRKWQRLVRRCRGKPFTYLNINKQREREDAYRDIPNEEVNEQTPFLRIPPVVHFTALRESLLSDD